MTLVPVNDSAEVEQRAGTLFHGRYRGCQLLVTNNQTQLHTTCSIQRDL